MVNAPTINNIFIGCYYSITTLEKANYTLTLFAAMKLEILYAFITRNAYLRLDVAAMAYSHELFYKRAYFLKMMGLYFIYENISSRPKGIVNTFC